MSTNNAAAIVVPTASSDSIPNAAALSSSGGGSTAANLLARSFLDSDTSSRRNSNAAAISGSSSPSSPTSRIRASSRAILPSTSTVSDRNMSELNDMMAELHRNQLWFTYVFTSTREGFETGALAVAEGTSGTGNAAGGRTGSSNINNAVDESLKGTLDEIANALEIVTASKKKMLDIQKRVDVLKQSVGGWRQKQINEATAQTVTSAPAAAASAR
jgi:hypothetical protein